MAPRAAAAPADAARGGSRYPRSSRGASSVEYGMLISGVAAVIAAVVFLFGDTVSDSFGETCDTVSSETATSGC